MIRAMIDCVFEIKSNTNEYVRPTLAMRESQLSERCVSIKLGANSDVLKWILNYLISVEVHDVGVGQMWSAICVTFQVT